MKMLTYTVAADTDGTVIDNRIPEETCGLIPNIVLSEIGDALVADDFRYLCIGVHTCQMVLASDKGLKKCLMGESACQFQIFFVACDVGYVGKYFVQSSMFAAQHILHLLFGESRRDACHPIGEGNQHLTCKVTSCIEVSIAKSGISLVYVV